MHHWLCFILLLITISNQTAADIRRWDALPAIDVMHLQGPYTGTDVCPMCRHGYDAGVLLLLPSSTAPNDAARIAAVLQATAAQFDDSRFRPFLILTGTRPSNALLAAIKSTHSNWYVAHLSTKALAEASKDFELPLQGKAIGYVFSQRRLLWAFDPAKPSALWSTTLTEYADYAMTFLHSNYANPVKSDNPDTPKGRLWLAPAKLSSEIVFGNSQNTVQSRLCVSDKPHALRSDALVALTITDAVVPKRIWWARTDNTGCLMLRGMQNATQLDAEVFSVLRSTAAARIDGKTLLQNPHLEMQLQSSGANAVNGDEVVVGLPCEGCEAVFQGLPTRFSAESRLAPAAEPGAPLLLSGVVTNQAGGVQSGVIVYAYQTDHLGIYPKATGNSTPHGRLRGWVQTDAVGRYAFKTIRPGAYPGTDIAQHIHMHIIEPGRCSYYLGDVLFDDDLRLSEALRAQQSHARGGNGIVDAKESGNFGWGAIRNITLGLNVPGYEACAKKYNSEHAQ